MRGGTLRELGDLRIRDLTGHLPSLELGDPFLDLWGHEEGAVVSTCMLLGVVVSMCMLGALGDPFLDSLRLRFCIRPFPQIVLRPRRARRRHRFQTLRLRLKLRQFRLRGGKLRHLVRGELSSLLLTLELGHASLHRRRLFACGGRRLRRCLRLCRTRAR